jgi:CelD/BcsL family acetyltransferase involved in cellulose biosynthesis
VHATSASGRRLVLGWSQPYGFLSTPLVRRDVVGDAVRRLVSRKRRFGPQVVVLRQSGAGGPVDAALAAAIAEAGLARAWERRTSRAVARPLDGPPRRRRRSLDRMQRRLQEHLGTELSVEDRSTSAAALDEFLALEAAGWKGAAGTALACNRGDRSFFVAMATGFAALGRLRLSVLSAGERTVAMSCDLLAGGALFGFKSCHDETLRRYAPGIQLFDRMLDRFHADRALTLYDSCSDPGATVMNELFGAQREIVSFVAVPRATAGAVREATTAAIAVRERIRRPDP